MNRNAKIVMIAMFKNEASVIRNMLDSVVGHIDYYVIQNNGSTDGSNDIVREWASENNIPGLLYDVEEGWVGFGWNRDHLIRKCQSIDHGCDWILKMDCDERLEVEEDFDWSPFDDRSIQAFNVPCVDGTSIYYRTWLWNAYMQWGFNHDLCHETIYCLDDTIGHNYSTYNLPSKFRHMGSVNLGESWSKPTKFISDALFLEEKLIRENTMLTDMYHFWYIGKSYFDSFQSTAFPLGESQQKEYARRGIYYFNEYISEMLKKRNGRVQIDEMSYLALIFNAEMSIFLKKDEEAIYYFKQSEKFAPGRNDHLMRLAEVYRNKRMYNEMLEVTNTLMDPSRVNPFPNYINFIDTSHYIDSPTRRVHKLHEEALSLVNSQKKEPSVFHINKFPQKRFFIVDNFYNNPDEIRHFALNNVEYKEDLRWYKGLRSTRNYVTPGIKAAFENIIGETIHNWDDYSTKGVNGCFQIMQSKDIRVYHYDEQKWAAMIYLSPNAPLESGTRLHRSRINNTRHSHEDWETIDSAFRGDFYDATKFDIVDVAGNIYNRLAIMDSRHIHSAGSYFGNTLETGRLTHLFFFD